MSATGFPRKAADGIGGGCADRANPADTIGGFTPKKPSVSVRTARADDVAATARIEQTCFDTYQLSANRLTYLQRTPRAIFRVAERDGAVVGHAITLVCRHRSGATGYLYSIAVDPSCRGQGIGRALLTDAIAQLVARAAKHVILQVERSNTAAVDLYERSGFRAAAPLPAYYGPGRDGVQMVCELAADVVRPAA